MAAMYDRTLTGLGDGLSADDAPAFWVDSEDRPWVCSRSQRDSVDWQQGSPRRLREFVVARDEQKCCVCHLYARRLIMFFLMLPSRGGAHHPDNLRSVCYSCLGAAARAAKIVAEAPSPLDAPIKTVESMDEIEAGTWVRG